jgi:hypothetical protein
MNQLAMIDVTAPCRQNAINIARINETGTRTRRLN